MIITDQDQAIAKSIEKVMGMETKHLLCTWHLRKNLRNHFAYHRSSKKSHLELKSDIMDLIECPTTEKFNESIKSIKERLENKTKSLAYIDRLVAKKLKFCKAFL